MIFKRLNRTAAESIFVVFQANVASIAADDVVGLETNASSVDGVKINQNATAVVTNHCHVGVADAAIANGAYGLVQIYGYRSTSRIVTTDSDYALGVALRPASAQDYLSTIASTLGVVPTFVLLESATSSSSTVSRKIFIRCM